MSLKEIIENRWVKFGFWAILYTAWVIWFENFWWLLGLIVIFDLYITKKVKWAFWKKEYKEGEKHNALLEWLDAIIFAVLVITPVNLFLFQAFKIPSSSMESTLYTGDHLFVSKLTYGPRIPQTPLTIPFTHNVIFGKESYSTLIQNDYRRIKGFRRVERGDIVVFGFPNGDTVLTKAPSDDYHALVRFYGKELVERNFGPLIVRPSDKKDHYVKRCVAVAGDTLSVVDGRVVINSEPQQLWPGIQYTYRVVLQNGRLSSRMIDKLGLNESELYYDSSLPGYPVMALTEKQLEELSSMSAVVEITPLIETDMTVSSDSYLSIFPYTKQTGWTRDSFGPLWIPEKGATVSLTEENLPLYRRIISDYEHNVLEVTDDGRIIINGAETESYTFKQDYYFMMGDNRHNSLDSRYWGFVPEDHIVGRPAVIWLSLDGNKKFPHNIRWNRFLRFV